MSTEADVPITFYALQEGKIDQLYKITAQKFMELTNEAKDNCPISGVLNCKISVEAALV